MKQAIDGGKELRKEDFPDFERTKPLGQSTRSEVAAKSAGQQVANDSLEESQQQGGQSKKQEEEQASRGWHR